MTLTKSDFLLFLDAPLHAWAKLHGAWPTTAASPQECYQRQQGYQVEALAKVFLTDHILPQYSDGSTIEFEVVLHQDPYEARIDAVIYDAQQDSYDLYEIKSGTSVHSHHKSDITFQYLVGSAVLPVHNAYIVHVNKQYRHMGTGSVLLDQFFVVREMMGVIRQRQDEIRQQRERAIEVLSRTEVPMQYRCLRPSTYPCPEVCWPGLPEYSVFDLSRASQLQLHDFTNQGIVALADIPATAELTYKQRLQCDSWHQHQPMIARESIQDELRRAVFPLYFLDYETYAPAVPLCDQYAPYQAMTFQFSLHVLEAPDAEPTHYEYLATQPGDPSAGVTLALRQAIGDNGTVIVWNKNFECGRNQELARLCPEHAEFLQGVNERTYDLMDVFSLGWYVDYRFHGSASIKKVLPVLVPELSYKELTIGEGATAMLKWFESVYSPTLTQSDRAAIWQDLRTYCGLDTQAMLEIWRVLWRVSGV